MELAEPRIPARATFEEVPSPFAWAQEEPQVQHTAGIPGCHANIGAFFFSEAGSNSTTPPASPPFPAASDLAETATLATEALTLLGEHYLENEQQLKQDEDQQHHQQQQHEQHEQHEQDEEQEQQQPVAAQTAGTINLGASSSSSSSSSSSTPSRSSKSGARMRLSASQQEVLERSFQESNYVDAAARARLAATVGLSQKQVAIWFQNKRARQRQRQANPGAFLHESEVPGPWTHQQAQPGPVGPTSVPGSSHPVSVCPSSPLRPPSSVAKQSNPMAEACPGGIGSSSTGQQQQQQEEEMVHHGHTPVPSPPTPRAEEEEEEEEEGNEEVEEQEERENGMQRRKLKCASMSPEHRHTTITNRAEQSSVIVACAPLPSSLPVSPDMSSSKYKRKHAHSFHSYPVSLQAVHSEEVPNWDADEEEAGPTSLESAAYLRSLRKVRGRKSESCLDLLWNPHAVALGAAAPPHLLGAPDLLGAPEALPEPHGTPVVEDYPLFQSGTASDMESVLFPLQSWTPTLEAQNQHHQEQQQQQQQQEQVKEEQEQQEQVKEEEQLAPSAALPPPPFADILAPPPLPIPERSSNSLLKLAMHRQLAWQAAGGGSSPSFSSASDPSRVACGQAQGRDAKLGWEQAERILDAESPVNTLMKEELLQDLRRLDLTPRSAAETSCLRLTPTPRSWASTDGLLSYLDNLK